MYDATIEDMKAFTRQGKIGMPLRLLKGIHTLEDEFEEGENRR
jgi:hypothetical protein